MPQPTIDVPAKTERGIAAMNQHSMCLGPTYKTNRSMPHATCVQRQKEIIDRIVGLLFSKKISFVKGREIIRF